MKDKVSTLADFVTDFIQSNHSLRPDMIDSIAPKVRLAVIELQKQNIFPETTISFESLEMKDEKRDSSGKLIYNFYELPADFRQLYNKGPAFVVDDRDNYIFMDYGAFIRSYLGVRYRLFTIHRFNGEHGQRNRLIAQPFPEDDKHIDIVYYSNGVDMPMDMIDEIYYMPVINHVRHQLGIVDKGIYQSDVNTLKINQQNPAGQGSQHKSFAKTKSTFFGNHKGPLR